MSHPDLSLATLTRAAEQVRAVVPATPQYRWPLLEQRLGSELWVKHENHGPTGAFKLRGGLIYMADLAARAPRPKGAIAATRGNHGQSVATAGARFGVPVTIVVPEGNSTEKNAAMRAQGARLIVHGHDFQAALEHARELAEAEGLAMVPSFHPLLVAGIASYALELFDAAGPLDCVYVPIGLGSGICAVIAARDALGLSTDIIGVVAAGAPAYRLSFEAGRPVASNTAETLADGMACRVPDPAAVAAINRGATRVVEVTDGEIARAMRILFTDTHNVAEGSGAAALAAALAERHHLAGKRVGVILSGGNVDATLFRAALAEADSPEARRPQSIEVE